MVNLLKKLKNSRKFKFSSREYRKKVLFPKKNVLLGAPRATAIVLEKIILEAKQPNSAKRKCVRVRLKKSKQKTTAFLMGDRVNEMVNENAEVTLEGIKKGNKPYGDLPGVRWKVVAINGKAVSVLLQERNDSAR